MLAQAQAFRFHQCSLDFQTAIPSKGTIFPGSESRMQKLFSSSQTSKATHTKTKPHRLGRENGSAMPRWPSKSPHQNAIQRRHALRQSRFAFQKDTAMQYLAGVPHSLINMHLDTVRLPRSPVRMRYEIESKYTPWDRPNSQV